MHRWEESHWKCEFEKKKVFSRRYMWCVSGTTLLLLLLSVLSVWPTATHTQLQSGSKNLDKVDALLVHCQAFMTGDKRETLTEASLTASSFFSGFWPGRNGHKTWVERYLLFLPWASVTNSNNCRTATNFSLFWTKIRGEWVPNGWLSVAFGSNY